MVPEGLKGRDGKFSWKKGFGTVFIISGIVSLWIGQMQTGALFDRIAFGAAQVIAGAVFWGFVTLDKIQALAKKSKE